MAGEVGVPVCGGKFLQGDLRMVNRLLEVPQLLRLKSFK